MENISGNLGAESLEYGLESWDNGGFSGMMAVLGLPRA